VHGANPQLDLSHPNVFQIQTESFRRYCKIGFETEFHIFYLLIMILTDHNDYSKLQNYLIVSINCQIF
jgi:hypothetical protein